MIWDIAVAMNTELLALRDAGCKSIQIEEPCFHFMANTFGKDHEQTKFMIDAYNREVEGLDDVELWIHTCWGNRDISASARTRATLRRSSFTWSVARATSGRSR